MLPRFVFPALALLAAPAVAQTKLEVLPLARLVPAGTTAYFEFASVEAAYRDVQALTTVAGEDGFETEDEFLRDLLSVSIHLESVALVDRKRPLAVALHPTSNGAEEVFLIPALDPAALAQALLAQNEGKFVFVSDAYVVWTDMPEYQPSSADHGLAVGSTRGSMRLRVDLAALLKEFEKEVRPLLESAREASTNGSADMAASWILDPSNAVDASFDAVDAFFASAKRLELNSEIDAGMARLLVQLDTIDGSPMARMGLPGSTVISRLASAMDLDQPLVVLFGADMISWRKHVGGFVNAFVEGLPEGVREDVDKVLSATDDDLRALGPGVGMSVGMSEKGMSLELVTAPTDALRCTTRVTEALANPAWRKLGLRVEGPLPFLVASNPGVRWRMNLDAGGPQDSSSGRIPAASAAQGAFQFAFPTGEMTVSLVQSRDLAALVVSADEDASSRTHARLGPVKNTTKELEFALQALGRANPCAVLQVDLARMRRGVLDMNSAVVPLRAPLVVWGGADGPTWRAGMAIDLAQMRAAIKADEARAIEEGEDLAPLTEANTELIALRGALESYMVKNVVKFPDTLDALAEKDANGIVHLADSALLIDPWGRPYQFEHDGSVFGPRIWTLGADGKLGGKGLDTDLDTDAIYQLKRK